MLMECIRFKSLHNIEKCLAREQQKNTNKGLRWIHFKCHIRGGPENNETKKQLQQKPEKRVFSERDKLLEIMCTSQKCAAKQKSFV